VCEKKYGKHNKKASGSSDLLRKGHAFLGQTLYKGPNIFFFKIWVLWVSKVAELNVYFKKYKLTLVTKKLFEIKSVISFLKRSLDQQKFSNVVGNSTYK
jgi:hypothetical protein